MRFSAIALILLLILLNNDTKAQRDNVLRIKIEWQDNIVTEAPGLAKMKVPNFKEAVFSLDQSFLPQWHKRLAVNGSSYSQYEIRNARFETLDVAGLSNLSEYPEKITLSSQLTWDRKNPGLYLQLIPLRRSASGATVEKLVSFDLVPVGRKNINRVISSSRTKAMNSVLSSGDWYKISCTKDGIYKITYEFLKNIPGLDVDQINPANIRLYGNSSGLLPFVNTDFRHNDLAENAIQVFDNNDGSFDEGDYFIFHAKSPDRWDYDAGKGLFEHVKHLYADSSFYFLNFDLGPGARIGNRASSVAGVTNSVNSFNDHQFYELDQRNYIKSGRKWYGEEFEVVNTRNFNFFFPNLIVSEPVDIKTCVGARSFVNSSFDILHGNTGQKLYTQNIGFITGGYTGDYGKDVCTSGSFNASGQSITITIKYNPSTSTSIGWLDFIELNARRSLTMNGSQMHFRDMNSVGTGNVSEFVIDNVTSPIQIWEVTDPSTIVRQDHTLNGSTASFRIETDDLRQFVAFDESSFFTPQFSSVIPNQNLHAMDPADMVIVVPPVFLREAERLAQFHRDHDQLRVNVVTTKQVFNEFSSGAQDATAIRDMMKMLYDQAVVPEDVPRFLLLFGDGSYDNKNRLTGNTNFIPSYQSVNSLALISSYVSDDYFGLLDDGEGGWLPGAVETLDLGIGRFPVKTLEEARNCVDKVINYGNPGTAVDPFAPNLTSTTSFGDWRNVVCFIGDDEDGNLHLSQSNRLAIFVDTTYECYNIDKIYFDAYPQVSTPGGQRYPSVNDAIDNRIDQGALLINYTGHGGEVGWAHEGVLDIPMINAWENIKKLPVFMTATCEFSRWDDPGRTSAGELTFLSPNGGAIALFTTVRLVYANTNFDLNKDMYTHVFEPINGEMPRMGDIFRLTKRDNAGVTNTRNFTLLGDPAVRLNYPEHRVKVTSINGNPNLSVADTLNALSKMTISGIVEDINGNKMTNFNGVLYPSVFDKPLTVNTLNNDSQSPKTSFKLQKNILYSGKASVTNGDWSFTFIVPKDIAYQFDFGRLSFYGQNGLEDAHGCFDGIVIGGFSSSAASDEQGPEINLFMNDEKFVFGGTTDENPFIYALVSDSNGINTVGNGIGHDITAQLDEESDEIFVLNDFYEANLNSYQTGKVRYPLQDLEPGLHSVRLKVWDIYNNSSEAYTEFVVASSAKLALNHVLNYPNPFTTNTKFFFEHNKQGSALKAQIQIYTVSGRLIKTIDEYVITEGFRSDGISWDGRDEFGDRIGKGVYIYKLKVRTTDGEVAQKTEKLVILK